MRQDEQRWPIVDLGVRNFGGKRREDRLENRDQVWIEMREEDDGPTNLIIRANFSLTPQAFILPLIISL